VLQERKEILDQVQQALKVIQALKVFKAIQVLKEILDQV
jgi:hypothetical protein